MSCIGIDLSQFGWPAAVWRDGRAQVLPVSGLTTAEDGAMPVDQILRTRKSDAERYLGEAVDGAVIVVPAVLTEPRRAILVEAAKRAGLEHVRLIHGARARRRY